MATRLCVGLSPKSREVLNELYDADNIEPARRVHSYLRKFAYDPPAQGVPSLVANANAILQREEIRMGKRKITAAELVEAAERFRPRGTEIEGGLWVPLSKKLEESLPLALAWIGS